MRTATVRIGVVLSSEEIKRESACQAIRQQYIDAMKDANAELVYIQPSKRTADLDSSFSRVSGLLLAGGSDINPKLYGQRAHPRLGSTDDLRDFSENYLFQEAYRSEKPVLGICRGMQMINVSLGGSLFQDLATDFKSKVNHQTAGKSRYSKLIHKIIITPGSQLRQIIKRGTIRVNSVHHQGIDRLGKNLRISARSESDGLIEGIESPEQKFLLGIQCHPESLAKQIQPSWRKLFDAFVKACR